MYNQTDWPDRIYVEESNHAKHSELVSKSENNTYPFKSAKEIFMFSLVLAFENNLPPKPLEKKKELIFERYLGENDDKPIIQSIYLLNEKDDTCIIDKKGAIKLAEELANRGFDELYDIVSKGYDMVLSLTEFLLEKYIDVDK